MEKINPEDLDPVRLTEEETLAFQTVCDSLKIDSSDCTEGWKDSPFIQTISSPEGNEQFSWWLYAQMLSLETRPEPKLIKKVGG